MQKNKTRGGAKFQPKTKCKAKDGIPGSIPSKLPYAVHAVQPTDVVDESRSSLVVKPFQVAIPDSLLAGVAVSNGCDDSYSRFGRLVGEIKEKKFANADIFFGLECLDQFFTQSSNNNGGIQIDDERTGTQEAGAFPDIMSVGIIASGRHARKFKPKPRLQTSVVTFQPAVLILLCILRILSLILQKL
ncbi:uncharacterized protein LOC110428770 isoform X2 [Herrania umbratica]|uniref:Uncharacterized protein LOC110428770 isoform X2 n=1 Tax=Herrania umbratica TaxID=108875 RepID=A0A6J1BLL2_9ROSI|nr:uncharacterized protein LOC110428770 isoform X2 [Herrania umbratica]